MAAGIRWGLSLAWLLSAPGVRAQTHNVLTPEEKGAGWQLLFNGKDIDNWYEYRKPDSRPQGWKVENGEIIRNASGGVHLVEKGDFTDFELAVDWKVENRVNSGINLRVMENADAPWQEAVKYQISSKDLDLAQKNPVFLSGGHHQAFAPIPGDVSHATGQWNLARIFVKGQRYVFYLNEIKTLDFTITGPGFFQGIIANVGKNTHGRIGLQDHDPAYTKVWFRNLKIRTVKDDANQPPRVRFLNGTSRFASRATIPIEVRAIDLDGTVSVKLFAGADVLASSDKNPFKFDWKNAADGIHLVKAVATDDKGANSVAEWRIAVGDTSPVSLRRAHLSRRGLPRIGAALSSQGRHVLKFHGPDGQVLRLYGLDGSLLESLPLQAK